MPEVAFFRGDLTYRPGFFQKLRDIKNFHFFCMKCRKLLLDLASYNKEETSRKVVITAQRRTVLLTVFLSIFRYLSTSSMKHMQQM